MLLSDKQVSEFQKLFFKIYGKKISKEQAADHGNKLVALMKVIYTPITKKEVDEITEQ